MDRRTCECGDTIAYAGTKDNGVYLCIMSEWEAEHSTHEQVSAEHCTNIRMYRKHTKGEDIV